MKKRISLIAIATLSLTMSLFSQTGVGEQAVGCQYTGNYSDTCTIVSIVGGVVVIYGCKYTPSTGNCGY